MIPYVYTQLVNVMLDALHKYETLFGIMHYILLVMWDSVLIV